MDIIHQLVNMFVNPMGITLFFVIVGLVLMKRRPRVGCCMAWGGVLLALLMGWNPVNEVLAWWLEKDYPAVRAEALPAVDAIALLGGGISGVPEGSRDPYPNLQEGADRAWHAARIWKAKEDRSLKIYCTSPDVSRSTPLFLRDLGVPDDCIVPLDGPWNTEAEAKRYAEELGTNRICLVTSAAHMKRALMIFRKYAPNLTVVPAATDHILVDNPKEVRTWRHWVPNMGSFCRFNALLHEYLGLVRYSLW